MKKKRKKKQKEIEFVYEQDEGIPAGETQRKVHHAYDILFTEVMRRRKRNSE